MTSLALSGSIFVGGIEYWQKGILFLSRAAKIHVLKGQVDSNIIVQELLPILFVNRSLNWCVCKLISSIPLELCRVMKYWNFASRNFLAHQNSDTLQFNTFWLRHSLCINEIVIHQCTTLQRKALSISKHCVVNTIPGATWLRRGFQSNVGHTEDPPPRKSAGKN